MDCGRYQLRTSFSPKSARAYLWACFGLRLQRNKKYKQAASGAGEEVRQQPPEANIVDSATRDESKLFQRRASSNGSRKGGKLKPLKAPTISIDAPEDLQGPPPDRSMSVDGAASCVSIHPSSPFLFPLDPPVWSLHQRMELIRSQPFYRCVAHFRGQC